MPHTVDSTLLHIVKLRLLTDYPAQVRACVAALSDEQMWWRPNDQANAVANLLIHLSWSNRYYLEEVIGGRPIGRNRDAEFSARDGPSKAEVLRTYDAAVETARGVLEALTPEQLATTTDRTGRTATYAQLLLHVSHHNADHVGQVVWITKMLQPGALNELWMQARARPAG